jgi:uncharacterized protein (TIGR02246 family)
MPLTTEDRLAILDLFARYAHTLDSADKDGFVSTWAEDGVFDIGSQETVRGREALRARFANPQPEGVRNRHVTTNILIDGDGDHATANAYVTVIRVDAEGRHIRLTGVYNDNLRKIDGAWKFAHRRLTPDGP